MKSSRDWWVLVILSAASVRALADPVLSVQPPTVTVQAGAPLTLDVSIAGITDLYAFQFDLDFDPAILLAIEGTEGSFLSSVGSTFFLPGTIDSASGTIAFNAASLIGPIPGVSGSGILAVFEFASLAAGSSAVSLSNVQLLDSNLNPLDFITSEGVVSVQSVPEPSSFPLAAVGAVIIAAARKRLEG